jgi:hypothetical protein
MILREYREPSSSLTQLALSLSVVPVKDAFQRVELKGYIKSLEEALAALTLLVVRVPGFEEDAA